jgi:AraC family L-rhamnose operon regulatory protein RhaS
MIWAQYLYKQAIKQENTAMIVFSKATNLIPLKGFSFNVSGGILTQPFQNHSHDFYELMIIFSGKGRHLLHGKITEIKEGDIYVIGPDTEHGFPELNNLEIGNVMFDPFEMGESWDILQKHPGFQGLFQVEPLMRKSAKTEQEGLENIRLHLGVEDKKYVQGLVSQLQRAIDTIPAGKEELIRSILLTLCFFLADQFEESHEEKRDELIPISRSLAFIKSHYEQAELSVHDVAQSANLSVRHLTRLFREYYGMSPHKYLQITRFERAAYLLKETTRSITEIAFDCGFNDSNYFSRAFKENYTQTPREFRKNGLSPE